MRPESIHQQRILFSALNWGMGHVARCLPILKQLQGQGNFLIIAGNESQRNVFAQYLDRFEFIESKDYPFQFKGKGQFGLDMVLSYKGLRKRLNTERKEVEELVQKHTIDLVISDHRYGFRSDQVNSFCITHQLNLPVKWYASWVDRYHKRLLKAFTHLWVPDFENSELAGNLSRNSFGFSCSYLGPMSRFSGIQLPETGKGTVVIVSGPAPYNQQLVNEVIERFSGGEELIFIAPEAVTIPIGFQKIEGTNWLKQDEVIRGCRKIISRSGYSTIMDNHFLQKELVLLPTPGQQEQEYLFELHNR